MIKNKLKEFQQFEHKLDKFKANLTEAAKSLANITLDVRPSISSVKHWDRLIEEWALDETLPLYIRKSGASYKRGSEILHSSGRILIPADNGPAHWSLSMCVNENLIETKDLKELIKKDQIPIAFVLSAVESSSKYKQTKHLIDTPNKKDWKIAHIESVGLKSRNKLENTDIEVLQEHFKKFMSPSNMFLFPKHYAGLAELDETIKIYKEIWFGEIEKNN